MTEGSPAGARDGAAGPGVDDGADCCLLCGDRIGAAEQRRVRNGTVMRFCCYGCSINYELVQRLRGAWT